MVDALFISFKEPEVNTFPRISRTLTILLVTAFVALFATTTSFVQAVPLPPGTDVTREPGTSPSDCSGLALATSADEKGFSHIVTVGMGDLSTVNVALESGEQPSLDQHTSLYVAVENGDVFVDTLTPGDEPFWITTDGFSTLDSDPAIRGENIVFRRNGELMIASIFGGFKPVVDGTGLSVIPGQENISWSPLGDEFAFVSGDDTQLFIYNLRSNELRLVGEFPRIGSLDWGPHFIAMAVEGGYGGGQILVVPALPLPQDFNVVAIDLPGFDSDPAFNLSGRLAFTTQDPDGFGSSVVIVTADRNPVYIGRDNLFFGQPTWLCEDVLAFQADIGVGVNPDSIDLEIYAMDLDTSEIKWISSNTSSRGRVQYGPVSSSNQNPLGENTITPWPFDEPQG